MMDVLLKLELGAYVTCVCTLSHNTGEGPVTTGISYAAVQVGIQSRFRIRIQESHVSAGDNLGVDCPGGRKKAARQQARLPLVLGVPAISSRILPTTVNIRVYAATAPVLILVTRPSCVNLN